MNTKSLGLTLTLAIALITLGYVNPSFADPPGMGGHNHDGGDSNGGDDATYSVLIGGDVMGNSEAEFPWTRGGGKKTINGQQHNAGVLTILSIFAALKDGDPFDSIQAANCFPPAGFEGGRDFPLFGGTIKSGKKGTAQAQFWFEAYTFTIPAQTLFYQLHFTGVFDGTAWLPEDRSSNVLTMNNWALSATNVGEDIKAISCIGEGSIGEGTGVENVFITVTER